MSTTQAIDLLLAVLNLIVAIYVVVRSQHWLGRVALPAFALAIYFLLRSAARTVDVVTSSASTPVELLLDVLLVGTLLLVITTFEPILRGIGAREDAARYRATEYERARRHYVQVVRHRLLNPVTVIKGSALTLHDADRVDEATRRKLVDAITAACDELENISLVPERRDDLERDLNAVPHDPERDRRAH